MPHVCLSVCNKFLTIRERFENMQKNSIGILTEKTEYVKIISLYNQENASETTKVAQRFFAFQEGGIYLVPTQSTR